jgi:hypothetical protein
MPNLRFPSDGFQAIEEKILSNPKVLCSYNFHELPTGHEAMTEKEINRPDTAHCLAGHIIMMTPGALKYDIHTEDVDDLANSILVASGRLPIPMCLFYEDVETLTKILRGRAAEERALQFATDIDATLH